MCVFICAKYDVFFVSKQLSLSIWVMKFNFGIYHVKKTNTFQKILKKNQFREFQMTFVTCESQMSIRTLSNYKLT